MQYPIKIHLRKSRLFAQAVFFAFMAIIFILIFSIILGDDPLADAIANPIRAMATYPFLAFASVIFTAGAFLYTITALKNTPYIEIDSGGLFIFNIIRQKRFRVDWKDINAVEYYYKHQRGRKLIFFDMEFKGAAFILKETKVFKKGAVMDKKRSSNSLLESKICVTHNDSFSGAFKDLDQDGFYNLLNSEFLKYKSKPPRSRQSRNPLRHSRPLFGKSV